MKTLTRVAGRLGWGVADQAVSSLTNFALGVAVARHVSTDALGMFYITFSTYLIVLALARPVTIQPLVIRYSTASADERRHASRAATGTAAAIGAVSGGVIILVGWLIGGSLGGSLIALGITLPGLIIQETWRAVFFAGSKGRQAVLNDLIWALTLLALLTAVFSAGIQTIATLVAAWGAAACVAAVAGAVQAKILPAPDRAWYWCKHGRDISIPLLGDSAVRMGGHALGWYLIGFFAGLEAVGAVKGAQLLLGPTNVIVIGMGLVAVPESARNLTRSSKSLLNTMVMIGSIGAAATFAWGALVFLMPEVVGTQLLGVSWKESHALIVPMTIAFTLSAAAVGARSGLLALAVPRRVLVTGMIETGVFLGLVCFGAARGGATGAAIAFALATAVGCALWWSQALKVLRRRPNAPTGAGAEILQSGQVPSGQRPQSAE